MRLLIVVNVDWFFLSHRLEIAKAAVEAGWEVHVATSMTDAASELEGHGFTLHPMEISRRSANPIENLRLLWQFVQLFRHIRPEVVHLVTIKPVLFGGIAARIAKVGGVVFAVSGLGHVFIARGVLGRIRRLLVQGLYKLALGSRNKRVIFQNQVDRSELERIGVVARQESILLPGSGFDVDRYEVSPPPEGAPVFFMASRLIRTKGVQEFVDAAEMLLNSGVEASFWLVGAPDHFNPEGMTAAEIGEIEDAGAVNVLGYRTDVPELMRSASVVVLPSYYGEGLPKVLIEAAAAGRPVITTDTPGCREAISPGKTGLLVEARDSNALFEAMRKLATDRELRTHMGNAGRERAEDIFRIQTVVAKHLEIYTGLTQSRKQ